jgi:thioredoxin 1
MSASHPLLKFKLAHYPPPCGLTEAGRVLTFANSRAPGIVPAQFRERWLMSTVKVTDANFKSEVMGAGGPVVVDFWAEWCGPCKMIGPALEEIAKEMQGKVTIGKLNVDENPGVASTYGIRSIPTLMLFKDGKMASSKVGAAPKSELKKWITEAI